MDINAAFPGSFLKAADLLGKTATVMIEKVVMEEVGTDQKPVVYFKGKTLGLVLNKTNGSIIADQFGPETDNWITQTITLYSTKVEFQGRLVDAIRVQHPGMQAPAQAAPAVTVPGNGGAPMPTGAPQAPAPAGVELDDEIPF